MSKYAGNGGDMKVLIDGVLYRPETDSKKEVKILLNELYSIIWSEACYDATNDESRKICGKLLAPIKRLNEIFGFKE